MSKIEYTVIIERFERLCDCNQEVSEEILRKTFDTIGKANEFVSSIKHNIQDSADPEFSLFEDRGGRVNIIEMSPDEDFEYETRFTINEVKRPEPVVDVIKSKLIKSRNELNDEEFEKLLNRLIDVCKNGDNDWGEFYK